MTDRSFSAAVCPCGCDETLPETCVRCQRDYTTVGNPYASLILSIQPVAMLAETVSYMTVLCSDCARKLQEFTNPELLEDPGYLARMDQIDAMIRDRGVDGSHGVG
ncbi:hypothetical protein ABZ867_11960 [Streptomyces cinnamoneus]